MKFNEPLGVYNYKTLLISSYQTHFIIKLTLTHVSAAKLSSPEYDTKIVCVCVLLQGN
jgi:hypothetical protein